MGVVRRFPGFAFLVADLKLGSVVHNTQYTTNLEPGSKSAIPADTPQGGEFDQNSYLAFPHLNDEFGGNVSNKLFLLQLFY